MRPINTGFGEMGAEVLLNVEDKVKRGTGVGIFEGINTLTKGGVNLDEKACPVLAGDNERAIEGG